MRGPPRRKIPLALAISFLAVTLPTACLDLDVANLNEPDLERALADPGDVQSLISASFNSWFEGSYGTGIGSVTGLFLSSQAFQHTSPWADAGMEFYSRIPRLGIENRTNADDYQCQAHAWQYAYRAASAVANGLKALDEPEVAAQMDPDELIRYRAFAKLVQGLAHGTVAVIYAQGFVLDEATDLNDPPVPVDYDVALEAALGYLDESISIAESNTFTLPFEWMQSDVGSEDLVRIAHSYKARFRALVARSPDERAAVDWDAVIADVDAGITATFSLYEDWDAGWYNPFLDYATWPNWGQLPYFMYGMADQSGNLLEWYALPFNQKNAHLPDGRPVLIVTPDLRFPQGSTAEEQRANQGLYLRIIQSSEEGSAGLGAWRMPDRGTWRWSWYKAGWDRGFDYGFSSQFDQPEITLAEMRLLKAEGLFRQGDLAGAATIINETRTAAGLSPTDASGTNPECVPHLPDGSCGDLLEMLKWEKRMETVWTGVVGVNWFFDGRGWGDLWRGTPLHLPVPCQELEVLQLGPCNTFGGPNGEMAAPVSSYSFPEEG